MLARESNETTVNLLGSIEVCSRVELVTMPCGNRVSSKIKKHTTSLVLSKFARCSARWDVDSKRDGAVYLFKKVGLRQSDESDTFDTQGRGWGDQPDRRRSRNFNGWSGPAVIISRESSNESCIWLRQVGQES